MPMRMTASIRRFIVAPRTQSRRPQGLPRLPGLVSPEPSDPCLQVAWAAQISLAYGPSGAGLAGVGALGPCLQRTLEPLALRADPLEDRHRGGRRRAGPPACALLPEKSGATILRSPARRRNAAHRAPRLPPGEWGRRCR